MTLIVGIWCEDGVVIGSDSAMTFGSDPGQPTITHHLERKIDVIDGDAIVAGTGAIGSGQRFVDTVSSLWGTNKLRNKSAVDIGRTISQRATGDFVKTNCSSANYGALVALPSRRANPELIEFYSGNLQPELKSKENWYVSMGSGQAVADPLLGFLRAAFWGDNPPSREDGIFCAVLVLRLACAMVPMGVAEPIQMAVLEPNSAGGSMRARSLSREELEEHREHVDEVMERFRSLRHGTRTSPLPRP